MPFNNATRGKFLPLPSFTRVSGATNRIDLPRVGFLARVYLTIRGTIGTVTGTPAPLGISAILRRVRLLMNSGIDQFNMSGPGYNYLLRPFWDFMGDPHPQNTGRSAVATAGPVNLDMCIPVAVNLRDAVGLIPLQNEQTLLSLQIDWETDANLAATSITWTVQPTVTPYLEIFTVPANPQDWPGLNVIHSIIEDQTAIPGAGQFTYPWPRGNTYLQMLHGAGIAQTSAADNFTRAQLRVNNSDFLQDSATDLLDIMTPIERLQQRIVGTIPIDLLGRSGLGNYDLLRDTIDSRWITALDTVIQASGAGTFYSVRRQLVPIR